MAFILSPHPDIRKFCKTHTTYDAHAYQFVQYVVSVIGRYLRDDDEKAEKRPARRTGHSKTHVSGQQLLRAIARAMLDIYGPGAIDVLDKWRVHRTEDFGRIVFDLVDMNLLGASETDSIHDFDNGYDFIDVFVKPFRS